jgi:N-acyl-D-amino-acid deacylase
VGASDTSGRASSRRRWVWASLIAVAAALSGCASTPSEPETRFDLIVRNGIVYDGSGAAGQRADVGINGDRVAALGDLSHATSQHEIDASGMAVAPGFINVLSWATESLLVDGRGMSDLKQGVTLEIFGEGESGGPLTEAMKEEIRKQQRDYTFEIDWTTLGEYLESMVRRGVSPNVASFVGATTVRVHELGQGDRDPTPEELSRMQDLVRHAMREGALGVGSSLIYAPAFFAETPELIALAQAAAESGGGYVSHVRNESYALEQAIDELIEITKSAGGHGEVYHLKAAGEANWGNMEKAIAKIDQARAAGLPVSADMYTYTAGATGLDAAMPLWVQAGGLDDWVARLRDPALRAKVIADIRNPPPGEENLYRMAGSPDRVKFIGFRNERLKPLTGKTLAEVMALRGTSAEDTIVDLVIEDHSRVDTVYFLMSEDNVRLGISQPWVSLGSDAAALAPEGVFLKSSTHPRAYGNFARLLGRYVREEQVLTLGEAIRRLTRLPASNWKLEGRGCIDPGCYADVVVFEPEVIADRATFDDPRQYAVGVAHVLVNGVSVIRDGEHTGATPGRVVRGPGWAGAAKGY